MDPSETINLLIRLAWVSVLAISVIGTVLTFVL